MGSMCTVCSTENQSKVREVLNQTTISPFFPSISFQFTNSSATKIPRNDCVIVDVTKKHPSSQPYFTKLIGEQLQRLEDLITLQKPGEIQVVQNIIPSIKVKDIIFMALPIWTGQQQLTIKNTLEGAIGEAIGTKHKSLVICAPENDLACLAILDRFQNSIQKVTFYSDDIKTLSLMKKKSQQFDSQQKQNYSEGSWLSQIK